MLDEAKTGGISLSQRVPRYTSYPTAPHFHSGINAAVLSDWLGALGTDKPVSLYLHVPFCNELCWYCGCNTQVVRRYDAIAAYADRLTSEIDLVAAKLPGRLKVAHLHWGGGSPNALSAADFTRLMDCLSAAFDLAPAEEVAIEIDARSLKPEQAEAYAAAGINRVSFGVQDLNDRVQAAIGRIQPFAMLADCVARVRAAGIASVNLDLMYGLPFQTVEDCLASVDQCLSLVPDRIAAFGYAHVPWMKGQQKLIDEATLPDGAARLAQAEAIAARLVAAGYQQIGLDHFARPGDNMEVAARQGRLHRNFQGYTADSAQVMIAFGASAIGRLPQGFYQNVTDARDYMERVAKGTLPVEKGLAFSGEDVLRGRLIERLMCDLAVDLGPAPAQAPDPLAAERQRFADLAVEGVVTFDGRRLVVTEAGRLWLRPIAAVFDQYLARGTARHSVAV